MSTFHPFPRLPAELRLQIWQFTIEPRIVDIQIKYKRHTTPPHRPHGPFLSSSTPIPAVLQTCRESRNAGLYQRAVSDLQVLENPTDAEKRYIWINFDIDMLDINSLNFAIFVPVAHLFQRLRFSRDNKFDESWIDEESREMSLFVNVREIHVQVWYDGDVRDWWNAGWEYVWPCGVKRVWIVDGDGGKERLVDLEEKWGEEEEGRGEE
jgi:hypothetical protein